jgi:hypothetical protein
MDARLASAFTAIDAANAGDPNTLEVRGARRPKEQAHAEMACAWVERLVPEPSDALLVAARAHHVRRWTIPRAEYPTGRKGYLTWRKALQKLHAECVAAILTDLDWDGTEIAQVEDLVRKRRLGRDAEAQALEDALCLIFLETQLASVADQLDDDHTVDVLRKSLKKMSAGAIALATELPLTPDGRALLERAVVATD